METENQHSEKYIINGKKCDYIGSSNIDSYVNNPTSTPIKMDIGNVNPGEKAFKFGCNICDYYTNKKCNIESHVKTKKHIGNQKTKKQQIHVCQLCDKIYNNRSGLWKHKRNCNKPISGNDVKTIVNTMNNDDELKKFLIEQNNEFKTLILEQNKQIIELSSKPATNKLILNSFLNKTCKNAQNLYDFVKQLQIGDHDLDETDRIGYVDGISKIFINALDQLDINQRPVHCRDTKRETVYIRHENQWEKEKFANVKLTNAIGHIVKMLQNIWKQRLIVKSQQANKSYAHPTTLIDVSEVTNAPRIDGTTIQESNTYYKRISRNIMKESIIEK